MENKIRVDMKTKYFNFVYGLAMAGTAALGFVGVAVGLGNHENLETILKSAFSAGLTGGAVLVAAAGVLYATYCEPIIGVSA